jgi:phenylalanyl-tRNA synthetase beta chain
VGKVAIKDPGENYGIATRQYLGFLNTHAQADYNESASHLATLMFYMGKEYTVKEAFDPRFIPGRQAEIWSGGRKVGVFGEIHPAVLEAFGIAMPSSGGEVDLDSLLENS